MTTQRKITAIQAIVTNHHDNVAAMSAANVGQGLEALVIEAMNTALKDDLAVIFAANLSRPAAGNLPAAQNVRRKRQACPRRGPDLDHTANQELQLRKFGCTARPNAFATAPGRSA